MGTRFRPSAVLCALGLALLWSGTVWAGAPVAVCGLSGTIYQSNCVRPDSNGAVPVTGSFSSGGTATAADPTYVEGATGQPLSLDLSGHERVVLPSSQIITTGTAGVPSTQVLSVQGISSGTAVGVSVASGGIASGALASGSVASGAIASGAVASGAVASGAFASGSISAGAVVAGASSFVKLEDVAAVSADAGVPAMAIQQATPADTAADGDYVMLQMSAGKVHVQAEPGTANGLTVYFVQPTASDNHVVIKAGAGQIYKLTVTNNSATVNYIRFYNATTGFNGCNSATNLVYQAAIPASTSVGGLSDSWDLGMAFATGISICVTSGYATTDTTNATASAMSVNVGYR